MYFDRPVCRFTSYLEVLRRRLHVSTSTSRAHNSSRSPCPSRAENFFWGRTARWLSVVNTGLLYLEYTIECGYPLSKIRSTRKCRRSTSQAKSSLHTASFNHPYRVRHFPFIPVLHTEVSQRAALTLFLATTDAVRLPFLLFFSLLIPRRPLYLRVCPRYPVT